MRKLDDVLAQSELDRQGQGVAAGIAVPEKQMDGFSHFGG
jgi:hypothetical protein